MKVLETVDASSGLARTLRELVTQRVRADWSRAALAWCMPGNLQLVAYDEVGHIVHVESDLPARIQGFVVHRGEEFEIEFARVSRVKERAAK